uniref:Copia protein n=1 Tax=Cajanus cajan TaxID=3821 RepID=A0A151TGR8_CAJCA|nr:Copia protein [Cajanus cajan]
MFVVCLCARFQANPKESHMKSVKRILKYLKGTTNVGLWYPKRVSLSLIGYSDSDYAGCRLDRKSTSGTCYLLGSALVSYVKNLVSKHIFARWQALLSCFDFEIEHIKGEANTLPDYLTREFLQANEQKH